MRIGAALPSPTSGTGAWLRAVAPQITTPTFTGQAKFDVGTAAAPSVSGPVGTSGLYVTAVPTVGIAVGGVEKVLVNSDGLGVGAAPGSGRRFHVTTIGSPYSIVTDTANGSSGIGVQPLSTTRLYVQTNSSNWTGILGQSDAGTGVRGLSTVSYGVIGESRDGHALQGLQAGSLGANVATSALYVYRNATIGAFDYTGPVALIEDATASTGNLLRCRKQGADMAILSPTGNLTLAGLTASRPVRTTAGKVLESYQMATQADTSGADLATLEGAVNSLLGKLRTATLLAA